MYGLDDERGAFAMNKLSHIEWVPSNSIHVEKLDAQHRHLFEFTNRLIDIFESGSDDVLPVINDMVEYLTHHFHEEQLVMIEMNYPDFELHNQAHMKFTEKVHEFIKNYSESNRNLAFDIIVFLRGWVRNHTTGMDKQIGNYLLKTGKVP
jgi:hemerythrin-like metal-binding protein